MKSASGGGDGVFPNTQWSLILRAKEEDNADLASEALAELCQRYWRPLYVFVRSSGLTPEDAQDQTQAFFEKLLRLESWRTADRAKGRLRSFLIQSMRYFLATEARKKSAAKRGGGAFHMDFAAAEAESEHSLENHGSPDKAYDRQWAISLINGTLATLQKEVETKHSSEAFQMLEPFLSWNGGDTSYAEVAKAMETSEGAVKLRVFRMRKRYRQLLRQEIAHTVVSRDEIDAELRDLFASVA